jgi:hypothetical protein
MDWKGLWKRLVTWLRLQLKIHEKEIKAFVNEMIDKAFQNLDANIVRSITPAIRRKITNKILADILIMGIDIGTVKGKSEIAKLTIDAINWFTKESEE